MTQYFLAKTDPDTYSIDDLIKEGATVWDGVHNYQAINVIKTMKKGDMAYIYHSQDERSIVGLMEITCDAYQNTNDKRYSWVVEVKFLKKYEKPLSLQAMKSDESFGDFILLRHSRLSTMTVPEHIHKAIEKRMAE
jgi:predicted RNA-binding protein with PUA-like domain